MVDPHLVVEARVVVLVLLAYHLLVEAMAEKVVEIQNLNQVAQADLVVAAEEEPKVVEAEIVHQLVHLKAIQEEFQDLVHPHNMTMVVVAVELQQPALLRVKELLAMEEMVELQIFQVPLFQNLVVAEEDVKNLLQEEQLLELEVPVAVQMEIIMVLVVMHQRIQAEAAEAVEVQEEEVLEVPEEVVL